MPKAHIGFTLVQSNSLETLADRFLESLFEAFAVQGDSAFSNPLRSHKVITPHSGINTWLTQYATDKQTVFAGVEFLQPADYLRRLYFRFFQKSEQPSVFEPDNMRWFIYSEISGEALVNYPLIREYLRRTGTDSPQKRFNFSKKIADLFNSYLLYRPEILESWSGGRRVMSSESKEVQDYEAWQMQLWQRILRVAQENNHTDQNPLMVWNELEKILAPTGSVAALETAEQKLKSYRVFLFGTATLPPRFIRIFKLISLYSTVKLYLLNPSRYYWGDILTDNQARYYKSRNRTSGVRSDYFDEGSKLLRSFGACGIDFLKTLYTGEDCSVHEEDYYREVPPQTLLRSIQNDLLNWSDCDSAAEYLPGPTDRSLTVHRCYSPLRELEVAKDYILSSLKADSTLNPGEICILTPDTQTYAPLLPLVFFERQLRCSVAEGQANPDETATFFHNLLQLPDGNFCASELFALFIDFNRIRGTSLSQQEESRVKKWIAESGIRWGLNGDFWKSKSGTDFGLDRFNWKSGLDRTMQGFACGDSECAIPSYTEVEGSDTTVFGYLWQFHAALIRLYELSEKSWTAQQWERELTIWFNSLFGSDEGEDEDSNSTVVADATKTLAKMAGQLKAASLQTQIPFRIIRSEFTELYAAEAQSGSILRGSVTLSSPMQVRSLPFKVIIWVGLNHDTFPGQDRPLNFDLKQLRRRPGDHSVRNADLYLFLESIVAAQSRLCLSYTAFEQSKGESIPGSSVIDTFLAYLDSRYSSTTNSCSKMITTVFPLHPFSHRYGTERLVTYASGWFRESEHTKRIREKLFSRSVPNRDQLLEQPVELHQLLSYLDNPFKDFFEQACNMRSIREVEMLDDDEPFTLDHLTKYQLCEKFISGTFSHTDDYSTALSNYRCEAKIPAGASELCAQTQLKREIENQLQKLILPLKQSTTVEIEGSVANCLYQLSTPCHYTDSAHRAVSVDAGKIRYKSTEGSIKRYFRFVLTHAILNTVAPTTSVYCAKNHTLELPHWQQEYAQSLIQRVVKLWAKSRIAFQPWFGEVSHRLQKSDTDSLLSLFGAAAEDTYNKTADPYLKLFFETVDHGELESSIGKARENCRYLFEPLDQITKV